MQPLSSSAEEVPSGAGTSQNGSVLPFFVLAFALSAPFFILGALFNVQILPGVPLSGLAVVCPALAAAILKYRESRTAGVMNLLKTSFDYERITQKLWYVPILLLVPSITALTYGVTRWTGRHVPVPRFSALAAVLMCLGFSVGALGEELGWSAYALGRMQTRWPALQAGLVLGLVWALWHLVPLVEVHRSAVWIAWWSIGTVASRVLMTWIYNNTEGSVFAAALYHDVSNLSWQLFPNHGSYWDPRIGGIIFAITAATVTAIWGPRKLSRRLVA